MTSRGYIGAGVLTGFLGALALGIATAGEQIAWMVLVGFVLLAIAGVLTLIGVIGEGVRIGMRAAADEDRVALRRAQELV